MTASRTADRMSSLCLWALRHAAHRRLALSAVLSTMLVKIGLDVL